MRAVLLFLCTALFPIMSNAETIGKTYPIIEPDMLQEIHRKLEAKRESGELDRLKQEAIARSMASAESPKPVKGIAKAVVPRTFYFDPTYVAPKTITDSEGRIVAMAGTVVNPFDYVNLTRVLLFFDGRDRAQVQKAAELFEHYHGMLKPILVAGPIGDLMRAWKRQIYFDQGGALTKRMGITRVPALVSQDGRRLRIDELVVN